MKEKEFLPLLKEKHGIEELNLMQKTMLEKSSNSRDIILLSPTGSGKTIAFILPVLKLLNAPTGRVQVVVIAPSRELVIQIAKVFNSLAPDFKVTALYGGHKVEDEVNSLSVVPNVIVATPGRLLDHVNRRNVDLTPVRILVMDEFDKTLEFGFEQEVKKIIKRLKNVSRNILTSATRADILPEFLKLDNPVEIDFLNDSAEVESRMTVNKVISSERDKLESLLQLLNEVCSDEPKRSIIFLNHRESAERVYNFLLKNKVDCTLYHGGLDQQKREMAISLFNNGSKPILVATDLAARGLDIEHVGNIIHYHQPLTEETYTHRNGRTARVDREGEIFLLVGEDESLQPFISTDRDVNLSSGNKGILNSGLETLIISSGKKEKVSKKDIVGFLIKECGLEGKSIGKIDVFDHYSLVAVPKKEAPRIVELSNRVKLKGAKRRVRIVSLV